MVAGPTRPSSLLHILIRLDELFVAADVLAAAFDLWQQEVIKCFDNRHGGNLGECKVARGEQRFVVHGAQNVRRLAGEGRLLVTCDCDHTGATAFGCLGNAHQALGTSGVGDYEQDVFGLHSEGKAYGNLAHLVRGTAQSQLRELKRGIERDGVGVAHGNDLDDVGGRQALHHRADRGSIDTAQGCF